MLILFKDFYLFKNNFFISKLVYSAALTYLNLKTLFFYWSRVGIKFVNFFESFYLHLKSIVNTHLLFKITLRFVLHTLAGNQLRPARNSAPAALVTQSYCRFFIKRTFGLANMLLFWLLNSISNKYSSFSLQPRVKNTTVFVKDLNFMYFLGLDFFVLSV